jgi:hypothetical protein
MLFRNLPRETEDNHDNTQSVWPVFPAEIRTSHLPNTALERYQPFRSNYASVCTLHVRICLTVLTQLLCEKSVPKVAGADI